MLSMEEKPAAKSAARAFTKAAKSPKSSKKRPSPLTLRLSEDELRSIRVAAKENGLNVSAYIRAKVFNRAGTRKGGPVRDGEALGRTLGLLGQSEISDSLKTLAYEARCGSLLLDEETQAKIEAAYAHVCTLRKNLIAALGLREGQRQ